MSFVQSRSRFRVSLLFRAHTNKKTVLASDLTFLNSADVASRRGAESETKSSVASNCSTKNALSSSTHERAR